MRVRKYKVTARPQTVRRRTARIRMAAVAAVAAVFCFFAARKAADAAGRAVNSVEWAKWRLAAVDAGGVPEDSRQAVLKLAALPQGSEVTSSDARGLEGKIASVFPELRGVSVRRGWASRTLSVSAGRRQPCARVLLGASTAYMDERGEIYGAEPSPPPELLAVALPAGSRARVFRPETAAMLKSISAFESELPAKPVLVAADRGETSFRLRLADGAVVEWGGSAHTAEKIARLAQVYGKARERFAGPYKINMKYFEDGRILLSR
ncbi:MAG: cell division protein FtsQ/DivIB [Elusimicrobiales bacterium]